MVRTDLSEVSGRVSFCQAVKAVIRPLLLLEGCEGEHRAPVGVLDDDPPAAAGDQPGDQLRDGGLGIDGIGSGSDHDRRVLARALHQLLDLLAEPSSLRLPCYRPRPGFDRRSDRRRGTSPG